MEKLSLAITILLYVFQEKFSGVDIRVRVSGGGHVAQIYAIRQAISKALVAYYQKCKLHEINIVHVIVEHFLDRDNMIAFQMLMKRARRR